MKTFFLLFSFLIFNGCIPKDGRAPYPSNGYTNADTGSGYIGNTNARNTDNSSDVIYSNSQAKYSFSQNKQSTNKKIIDTPNMHKATMRRYCIEDKCYTPAIVKIGDTFEGVASWYGKKFHGKKTSNGEVYNMYGISAAHKTFPMNTIVKVTNLENQKTVILRINDRGPFVNSRIIDLSYGAAKKVGSDIKGLTKVRLEVLGFNGSISSNISEQNAFAMRSTQGSGGKVEFMLNKLALQIGAFKDEGNAKRMANKYELNNSYRPKIKSYIRDGEKFYRVIITGFKSYSEINDYKDRYDISISFVVGE